MFAYLYLYNMLQISLSQMFAMYGMRGDLGDAREMFDEILKSVMKCNVVELDYGCLCLEWRFKECHRHV